MWSADVHLAVLDDEVFAVPSVLLLSLLLREELDLLEVELADVVRADDKPGISNLIELLSVIRGTSAEDVEREFAASRYGDFKVAVGEAVVDYLAPVRERYTQLREDEPELERILGRGAERARAMAAETLADVRERMGVGPASVGPRA